MASALPIELPVTADTGQFARKLRAMADAYKTLADTLDAIDADGARDVGFVHDGPCGGVHHPAGFGPGAGTAH